MKLILILRRDPEDLTPEEKKSLGDLYPEDVTYRRIDPADYLEHDQICAELNPTAVILPMDRPIPSLAMEHGIRHIVVSSDKPPMELLPLAPSFKPYVP